MRQLIRFAFTASFLSMLALGCKSEKPAGEAVPSPVAKTESEQVERTIMAEAIIAGLRPNLSALRESIDTGSFSALEPISLPKVDYQGVDAGSWQQRLQRQPAVAGIKSIYLDCNQSAEKVDFPSAWWATWRQAEFSDCSFGSVEGIVIDVAEFKQKTVFDGKFRLRDKSYAIAAKQELTWVRKGRNWKLAGWKQLNFKLSTSGTNLFQDVTSVAIADSQTLETVTRSAHQDLILQKIKDKSVLRPFKPKHPFIFDLESGFQFPGVNIVDYDLDGDEDIFLVEQWQPCVMLENVGDGVYRDATQASGLIVEHDANCATFADFDNDGDPDVFIGRFTEQSLYFENENGWFTRRADFETDNPGLTFASTASPIDFNQDGLLDLYLTTYGSFGSEPDKFVRQYFPEEVRAAAIKATKKHPFLDRPGPPNKLLVNQGGKLMPVPPQDIGELMQWRNSFQTVWHDFDGDGDQDLYLCNDFAPDVILKNETERLADLPRFVDATAEFLGSQPMGFGMGASLGDYDNDGDLDVYVSNMYSKAGNRIFKHFAKVNENFVAAAQGNYLYQWDGNSFKQVAGYEQDQQHVAKVGWSFGGQFADFNNDGRLDVYVPSGFFTAPAENRADADL